MRGNTKETRYLASGDRIIKQSDLYNILPFKKTKVQQLIRSGELPLVKIGKDYVTTESLLHKWILDHVGEEIFIN